jgi:hypothetical protein
MKSSKCECGLPRGQYKPGCPGCDRREKQAIWQRQKRNKVNAPGVTVDAVTATALLNGWHVVNDGLVDLQTAWRGSSKAQHQSALGVSANDLAKKVNALSILLGRVLDPVHLVIEGETAIDCRTRQVVKGKPRGH